MRIGKALVQAGLLAALPYTLAGAQAPAAQPTPPSVSVGGVLYAQFQYALRSDSLGDHANNFDLTRVYFTGTARLAKGVGARMTLESFRPTSSSGIEVRVKYGFAQLTPEGSALSFKVGQIQTPWVDYDEGMWDYRSQGSIAMDRAGYLSSADLGLSVDGSWNRDMVTMSAGVYDGETYRVAPGDHHKDAAARLTVRLAPSDDAGRFGGLRLTGFGLYGEPNRGGTRQRWLGQLSYRSNRLMLAGAYAATRDRVDSTATATTLKGSVASIYGWVRFGPAPLAILARVDLVDPNTAIDRNGQTRYIGGVSYRVSPNLRLIADIDHLSYRAGAPNAALDAARSQALFQVDLVF